MIDNEDRNAIGVGMIRLVGIVALILLAAATVGAAVQLFQIVSGI